MKNIAETLQNKLNQGEPVVMATIVEKSGSAPRDAGAKMLVFVDGSIAGTIGGGVLEAKSIEFAMDMFKTKSSQTKSFNLTNKGAGDLGMICGGAVTIDFDYMSPDDLKRMDRYGSMEAKSGERLCVFGGGHVAQPMIRYANDLGFHTAVVDDRAEFANADRFPEADEIWVTDDYLDLEKRIGLASFEYIIIVTRGHAYDKEVLAQALKTEADYIGMIGSRSKRDKTYELLRSEGYAQEDIDRVHCPIGLSINAETPEEIAVSIAAELIQNRRSKT